MKPSCGYRRIIALMALAAVMTFVTAAQTVPADRDQLEKGEGGGMAMIAEMYGYPGPRHLLDLAGSLRMGPGQVQQIANLYDEVRASAAGKGNIIIMKEEELEELFESGRADETAVSKLASDIGRLRGELRAIHLLAHLKARELLTKEQRARYTALRGATGQQKTDQK